MSKIYISDHFGGCLRCGLCEECDEELRPAVGSIGVQLDSHFSNRKPLNRLKKEKGRTLDTPMNQGAVERGAPGFHASSSTIIPHSAGWVPDRQGLENTDFGSLGILRFLGWFVVRIEIGRRSALTNIRSRIQ